jgi:hypothetical protein
VKRAARGSKGVIQRGIFGFRAERCLLILRGAASKGPPSPVNWKPSGGQLAGESAELALQRFSDGSMPSGEAGEAGPGRQARKSGSLMQLFGAVSNRIRWSEQAQGSIEQCSVATLGAATDFAAEQSPEAERAAEGEHLQHSCWSVELEQR